MMLRHQLPATSPVTAGALVTGVGALVTGAESPRSGVARRIADRYGAEAVALTDSGTAALILALRMTAGAGGTVAYPGYACVDLVAAARYTNVRVRLYDLDPVTLSPDLVGIRRVLERGVDALVVAHLYGFPADVQAVRTIAAEFGVPVIEDAAQAAGATLDGRMAGSLGHLSVLSFGRGKGTTAGAGGALLAITPEWREAVQRESGELEPRGRGAREVAVAAALWALGRPALYSLPSAIPGLHLGETIYHSAHEPRAMSAAAAAVLQHVWGSTEQHTAVRRRNATALEAALASAPELRACRPVRGAAAGYLRLPVLDGNRRSPAPRLGIVRGYPRPLSEQRELRDSLHRDNPEPLPGARELARSLFTLPTHHMVNSGDLDRMRAWLRAA